MKQKVVVVGGGGGDISAGGTGELVREGRRVHRSAECGRWVGREGR